MENTLENKAKFFAQYWGQNVLSYNEEIGGKRNVKEIHFQQETFLELTPLHLISDEDAIELAKIFSFSTDGQGLIVLRYDKHISINDKYNDNQDITDCLRIYFDSLDVFSLDENENLLSPDWDRFIEATDYLRSKGYYLGKGTEINYGWANLRTK